MIVFMYNKCDNKAMRNKESVRFETYFKLQWFDETSICWRDVQKAYNDEATARKAMTNDKKWRVMCITEKGRFPI